MSGSRPYSSSHRHQASGPPAPEWRVPAAPPRPASIASPPPPSYNPGGVHGPAYGTPAGHAAPNAPPAPGFAGANTAIWGVNYNNKQYPIYAPPPLPPRPSSTTGQPSSVQHPIVSTADPHNPSIGAPAYGGQASAGEHHQHWTTNTPYVHPQPATSVPPPPPPPPPPLAPAPVVDAPSYQHSIPPPPPTPPQPQQIWHQSPPPSYSAGPVSQYHPPIAAQSQSSPPPAVHAPTHHPSPSFSQQVHTQQISSVPPEKPASQSPAPALLSASAPPVPPKTSPLIIPTGASALGAGAPSDWEHLSPIAGEIDDVDIFKPRKETPATNAIHEPLPGHQASTSGVALNNRPSTPPPSNSAFANYTVNAGTPQSQSQPQPIQSPISPGTQQDFQPPVHPTRVDSAGSDYSTVSAVANSESIDGLIEAWNKPLSTENKPSTVHQSPKVGPESVSSRRSPSPVGTPPAKQPEHGVSAKEISVAVSGSTKGSPNEPVRKTENPRPQSKPVDRYEDLDSWSQSSMERYVAMLRKEAVADSDQERFNIFTAFMAKETKLREILYSIEHEPKSVAEGPQQSGAPQPQTLAKEAEEKRPPPDSAGLIPVETEEGYFGQSIGADSAGDGGYSPGGRPILPRLHTPKPPLLQRSASNPSGHKYSASHAIAAHALRSTSVPPMMNEAPRNTLSPLTTHPPQRIYTPFRYTEGPQRGSDKLHFDRPAYQAYSALRQASAESGRVMADAPVEANRKRSSSGASVQNDLDETFVGLIREKSVSYRQRPPQMTPPPPLPASLRQGKPPGPIEDLRTVVSSPVNKQSESLWHSTVRKDLEKYTDDFNWVRETFKPWEASSKARRENLDKERIKRQAESESHIDALFNGKEIGYADINILEEEFRQSEARTQLEEERGELEDFISNVFNVVDKRLEQEIATLRVHYDSAFGQLDRENSNREDIGDKHSISHTMKIVNEIHHRLELRHHKRLEIALDRERRRKKAERRPLVFMGDSAALKKLDTEFDQMERQNILEAARARDERANKLMDLFDDAIMRGLGENQSILDDLAAKVARVDEVAIRSSGLPDAEIEQILKSVYALVASLRKDSESILHSFGRADSALNNADYSVSVAEARYSSSEPDVFRQLEAEKKKEDAKIQDNLRSKLQSVRVGPAKITNSINDALRTLGKTPFPEQPVPSDVIPASDLYDVSLPNPARPASTTGVVARKMDGDPEHRERLRKALEEAKKRNAARQHSSSISKE
ncbi:uncharacterized protein BJX67DRAFT_334719 [Aspergillus lucknowensis]|uniref:Uncharacterized protein n=1 Tax=Aspergillus lucknowensis TaxID=176173 RepID=A0ABR4L818_9EURO